MGLKMTYLNGRRFRYFDEFLFSVKTAQDKREQMNSITPRNIRMVEEGTSGSVKVYEEDEKLFYSYLIKDFNGSTVNKVAESVDVIVVHTKDDGRTIFKCEVLPVVAFMLEGVERTGDTKSYGHVNNYQFEGYGFHRVYDKLVVTDVFPATGLVATAGKYSIALNETPDNANDPVIAVAVDGTNLEADTYELDAATGTIHILQEVVAEISGYDPNSSEFKVTYVTTKTTL